MSVHRVSVGLPSSTVPGISSTITLPASCPRVGQAFARAAASRVAYPPRRSAGRNTRLPSRAASTASSCDRPLPGTAAEAGLQLQLELERPGVGVGVEPEPDVVQAVLQVLVAGAGVELRGGGGGDAVVVVAQRVGVADPPLFGDDVRPDVQLDQAGPGVERLRQIGVRPAFVRVVRADHGGRRDPGAGVHRGRGGGGGAEHRRGHRDRRERRQETGTAHGGTSSRAGAGHRTRTDQRR